MRKLFFVPNVISFPPDSSPSPSQSDYYYYYNFPASPPNYDGDSVYNYFSPHALPVAGDGASEIAAISIIALLLFLSLFSLLFIFHLRVKSQWSHHLQNFSSAWSVRLLLVVFIICWALNEIIRLPFLRRHYIYPFLGPLSLSEEANVCKIYLTFSLGLYEPGIFAAFLFLVRISVKNKVPNQISAITTVASMCLPVFMLQIFVVFLSPLQAQIPQVFYQSSVITEDISGDKIIMCTYPLASTIVFTGFGMLYTLGFSLSCWKVLSVVINKSIINRINILALTTMTAIPVQSVLLALSTLWSPGHTAFSGVTMGVFLCTAVCAIVGLGILVIKPTADALGAAVDFCKWNPNDDKVEKSGQGDEVNL